MYYTNTNMFNLPTARNVWKEINNQFLKGGFDWYGQRNPHHNDWYYLYYISEGEKRSCKMVSKYSNYIKVTTWLRNIEKFEEIHNKYLIMLKTRKRLWDINEIKYEWNDFKMKREWRRENSMSNRRTKYEC